MSQSTNFPFFPKPPGEYDQFYMDQLVRAISVFAQQTRNPVRLRTKDDRSSATQTGVLMWNGDESYPEVSINGAWKPFTVLGFAYGSMNSTSTQTLATGNSATAVTLDNELTSYKVAIGTPSSRISVSRAGLYKITASIQIQSTSSSTKTGYFWIKKNGTDVANSTRAVSSHVSNGYVPITLDYEIRLVSGDYVELYWAGTTTNLTLTPVTGLAFAPDVPSVLVNMEQLQL